MRELAVLNKYFWNYKFHIILGILFVGLSNIAGVFPARVVRIAFDLVGENVKYYQLMEGSSLQPTFYESFSKILVFFGLTVLALAIIKGVFMFLMRQTLIVMSRLIEYDLRNEMYAHYQGLGAAFYKRNQTGDLMSRIAEDVNKVRMYLGPAILYGINLVGLFIVVIGSMLQVNARLTFIVLLPLPLLSISIYYVNTIINKRSEIIQSKMSDITTIAQESFSGIRVLKSYVKEPMINGFFSLESEDYKNKSLDLAQVHALFFPLMILLIGLSTLLTIYVGGNGVADGTFTPGNIAEFIIYVAMLTWPVTSLGWIASIIQAASASQKRINEFLNTKGDIVNDGTRPASDLKGNITFNNVSFTYPDTGITALRNVSFEIKAGQKVAVVGKTGSGKSSLVELLLRVYDISAGEILLDQHSIKSYNLNDLRWNVGYVPQDVFVFSDSIYNNVAFGVKEASTDDVKAATKAAVIHESIERFPEGYFTKVGERGVTLSGGQKQRLSLARAIIKNPQLLIFDDSLSAVDASTEQAILKNLSELLKDKTAIIVTHRIYSLLDFDLILVLEDGKLVEAGSHNELLKLGGQYTEMYENQQLEADQVKR